MEHKPHGFKDGQQHPPQLEETLYEYTVDVRNNRLNVQEWTTKSSHEGSKRIWNNQR